MKSRGFALEARGLGPREAPPCCLHCLAPTAAPTPSGSCACSVAETLMSVCPSGQITQSGGGGGYSNSPDPSLRQAAGAEGSQRPAGGETEARSSGPGAAASGTGWRSGQAAAGGLVVRPARAASLENRKRPPTRTLPVANLPFRHHGDRAEPPGQQGGPGHHLTTHTARKETGFRVPYRTSCVRPCLRLQGRTPRALATGPALPSWGLTHEGCGRCPRPRRHSRSSSAGSACREKGGVTPPTQPPSPEKEAGPCQPGAGDQGQDPLQVPQSKGVVH